MLAIVDQSPILIKHGRSMFGKAQERCMGQCWQRATVRVRTMGAAAAASYSSVPLCTYGVRWRGKHVARPSLFQGGMHLTWGDRRVGWRAGAVRGPRALMHVHTTRLPRAAAPIFSSILSCHWAHTCRTQPCRTDATLARTCVRTVFGMWPVAFFFEKAHVY